MKDIHVSIATCLLCMAIPAHASGYTFMKETTVPAGVDARGTRLVDMDEDGYPDLLTLSETQDVLNLLFNTSGSTASDTYGFGSRQIYSVGEHPTEIGTGDIDGDGRDDIVVASREDDELTVFLVRDAGTLVESARLDTGNGPYDVLVRDLDGDGDNDLVVGERIGDSVSVILSDGDGYGFAVRRTIDTVAETRQIALGDFDADGDPDLAVAGEKLQIYLNDGNANFKRSQTLGLDDLLQCAVAADLDEDGADDLIVTGLEKRRLHVLRADADGKFSDDTSSARYETFAVSFLPNVIAVANIDDDGHVDVIATSRERAETLVWYGTGHGGLVRTQLVKDASALSAVSIGDVDRDGRNDLVATLTAEGTAAVYRGLGSVPYDIEETLELGSAPGALVLDIVAGGSARVLVADGPRKLIHVARVTGDDFTLKGEISTVLTPATVQLHPVDGGSEVFHAPDSGTRIGRARLDSRDAVLALPEIVVSDGFIAWTPGAFSSAGARELLVVEADGDLVLRSLDDTGDAVISSLALAGTPLFIAAADLDGDGLEEAVFAGDTLRTMSAQGGTIDIQHHAVLDGIPDAMRLSDVDNDGDADVLLVYTSARRVDIHLNDAGQLADAATSVFVNGRPVNAVTPDIDGDGKADLAIADAGGNRIELLARRVDGGYRTVNYLGGAQQAVGVLVLPPDDSRVTPLLTSYGTDGLAILYRRSGNRAPAVEDLVREVDSGDTLEDYLVASDADGDDIRFVIMLPPDSGHFELLDPVAGRFQYQPAKPYPDEVYVHYVAVDGKESSEPAVLAISVKGGGGGGSGIAFVLMLVAFAFRDPAHRKHA